MQPIGAWTRMMPAQCVPLNARIARTWHKMPMHFIKQIHTENAGKLCDTDLRRSNAKRGGLVHLGNCQRLEEDDGGGSEEGGFGGSTPRGTSTKPSVQGGARAPLRRWADEASGFSLRQCIDDEKEAHCAIRMVTGTMAEREACSITAPCNPALQAHGCD